MADQYTAEQLESMSSKQKDETILLMQTRIGKLESEYASLMEQVRVLQNQRYGRKSEKLDVIDGQLSFFDEAEFHADPSAPEPEFEEVLPPRPRRKKKKGQREEDLKDFPEEHHDYTVSEEELNAFYGEGNWREMTVEDTKHLHRIPQTFFVEVSHVHVYVGTGGDHQDEFIRADHPKHLFRNSIATPSLLAGILNAKYVNSMPLERISKQFSYDDLRLSKQTMSNWIIHAEEKYLRFLYDRLIQELMKYHVQQCDETPVTVKNDFGPRGGTQGYMWVHRSGEFYKDKPIVLYEYQKSRGYEIPKAFYKDFDGILVTDSLQQYHKLENDPELHLQNANCWAHARRDFADAVKAAGKISEAAAKQSIAYQALVRIAGIYKLEEALADLSPGQRLRERKRQIEPLCDEYFAWVKAQLKDYGVLKKGKTGDGLRFSVNQEKYLRRFLTDGEIPIDNSASERSIRTFCVGRKNWVILGSKQGAQSSAVIYSLSETAKLNGLNPYYYFNHLLTELPKLVDEDGNIDASKLDHLLPWAEELPEECHKIRR